MSKAITGTGAVPALLPSKQIGARITSVLKATSKLMVETHGVLIQCLLHAEKHGDCSLLERLVNGMYDGATMKSERAFVWAEGVKAWIKAFSPIRWDKNGIFAMQKRGVAKDYTEFNTKEAWSNPFWMLTKQKEVTDGSFEDLIKAASRFIKTAPEKAEKGKYTGDVTQDIAMAERILAELKAYRPTLKVVTPTQPEEANLISQALADAKAAKAAKKQPRAKAA